MTVPAALPRRVVVQAPGKINLSLAVGAVDGRGYHELATVFHAVDLLETVTARAVDGEELTLAVDSDVPGDVPLDGTNLALRAATLLRERTGTRRGAALHVDKRVPVAGGMGGGSADAAAALVALDALWGLDLGAAALTELAGELGADVPFALLGGTALGRGTGGDLTPLRTGGDPRWVLAVPGGHLSTPAVYRRADEIADASGRTLPARPEVDARQLDALAAGDTELLAATLSNDLQEAAMSLHPGLAPVLDALRDAGAPGALVSGSGPTLAALARDERQARAIAGRVRGAGVVEQCLLTRGGAPGARVLAQD